MGSGSKGDVSPMVWIVVAIIVAGIVLYILWIKGVIPFFLGINEAECSAYFARGCQLGYKFDDTIKNAGCASFGKNFVGYDDCFPTIGGTPSCEDFCNLEQST